MSATGLEADPIDIEPVDLSHSLHGFKYHDANANGQRDADERGMPGWTIQLRGVLADGTVVERSTETMEDNPDTLPNEAGRYQFHSLRPGRYVVSEVQQQGWQQSQPADVYEVSVGNDVSVGGLNFGNFQFASIHGVKWFDANANGEREDDERLLPNWRIIVEGVDGMGNDVRHVTTTMEDNPLTAEDETGQYWVRLTPGKYRVVEELRDGWQQTAPESGGYGVALHSGQHADGLDFGNTIPRHAQVYGMKWHDLDADGVRDPNEPGLANWRIILEGEDVGGNPVRIPVGTMEDNPDTRVDETGWYSIEHVPAGRYKVTEVLREGWEQSAPSEGGYEVRLEAGDVVDGLDFGNYRPGSVHGIKWHDTNANGRRDREEPGIPGVRIVVVGIDGMGNEVERSVATMQDDPETDFDESGHYWISGLKPGRYEVFEVAPDAWKQSAPPAGSYHVGLVSGGSIGDLDFGNFKPGSVHGLKFHDLNANGHRDDGEPALAGWRIVLRGFDGMGNPVVRSTLTMEDNPLTSVDETGHYWFEGVKPGTYQLDEILVTGWEQSSPEHGFHQVRLASGEHVRGLDFGNYQPASVRGRKWLDLNGNGEREPWEAGLGGWTIVLKGIDGMGNEVERRTQTMRDNPFTDFDEGGLYAFQDLKPGKYRVAEVLKPDWTQVYPATNDAHAAVLQSGDHLEGLDFGNQSPYRADRNGDGRVDAADAGIIFSRWGSRRPLADVNEDGLVDAADAAILFEEWTGPIPRPVEDALAADVASAEF